MQSMIRQLNELGNALNITLNFLDNFTLRLMMKEEHRRFCSESHLRYQSLEKGAEQNGKWAHLIGSEHTPSLHALVPRLFENESYYMLVSFVFDAFTWQKISFIETNSFTKPKCHMKIPYTI